jgi:predicted nucleic acid-binding protein
LIPGASSGLIVDASVAVKWVVEEEFSGAARSMAGADLYAPDLLYIECANILWKKTTKGDLTEAQASQALKELQTSPVVIVASAPLLERALAMAGRLRHPVYDCVYLTLAADRKVPMVTADERLARVAAKFRLPAFAVLTLKEISTIADAS